MHKILFILIAPLLAGCAGLEVAYDAAGDRFSGIVGNYCNLSAGQRQIARGAANAPLEGEALILIACRGDTDFESLHTSYILPYTQFDPQAAILNTLLEQGSYTLPDGTKLKIVAETPEAE